MLHWFRVRRSRIAAVTLAWFAALGGSAVVLHGEDCHDAEPCVVLVVEHDESAHRVGSASASDDHQPLHCVVCHWVRVSRPRTTARVLATPASDAGTRMFVECVAVSGRAPVAQPPLRSPPPSPALV